jgi:hypothetical protein
VAHNNERDIEIDYRTIRNKNHRDKHHQFDHDHLDSDRRSITSDRSKHFDRDEHRPRKHSPPISGNRSRHSSLSNRSNHEFELLSDHDRKKSGSRLSFADEIEHEKHSKHKHTSDNPLRGMLKGELNRARSTESLRDDRENHERERSRGREKDLHERESRSNFN